MPGFYTCPIPYHLGESLQGREVYRYLERTSDLELATAAHILKLDRFRTMRSNAETCVNSRLEDL